MARGETRGQRRKRRRRERTASPAYPDRSTPPSERRRLREALAERPRWVKALWSTPARRMALSAAFCAPAVWVLVYAITDPDDYFGDRRSVPGFIVAPGLLLLFGIQFAEAARDLATGRDSQVPVFHRISWWLDRRGLGLAGAYVVLMVVALIVLRD